MHSLWFWKNWTKDFRWIWYLALGLSLFSVAFFLATYFQGADGVIHWERIQEQKIIESALHSFKVGHFELSVPAENYIIIEYFNGSAIAMNYGSSILFVFMLVVSLTLLLAIITTLPRYWYFIGMTLFILIGVSFRLEVIAIFFQRNQIPGITLLVIFCLLSYYFHALNPGISFVKRLLIFLGVISVAAILIYFFSGVQYPLLHMAVTGYTAALIISVLFILMIAHEIPASFVYIASQGNSKSLRHFTVISVIYIVNVIITCLHEINVIHWNFVYLNPYLLLFISAGLGLWGFKLRETLYSTIFPFAPYGAYVYVALATICFITVGQFFATSNDAALRIIRDAIIFSHVGYGVIFLTYVFSNFVLMLSQNLPVYKVLYKANRMPYFSFRLAGLIMTLAFVFYSNWSQYIYNGIAGFYNNIGDLYALLDRSATAEAYYEQGRNYGFENNHANYALGALKIARYNFEGAQRNYELANGRRPTPYSLVNAGNILMWENKLFESIAAYKSGNRKIPNTGEIENNLGSAYGRVHDVDSALLFLNKARRHANSRSSAETNFFAIAALEYIPINYDSVLKIFEHPSEATLSNAIALATVQQKKITTTFDLLDKKRLTLYSATLLSNFIIQNAKSLDSTFVDEAYRISSDSLNRDYSEALKSSIAFSYYHLGNVSKALKVLAELAYISQSHQGKFNYIMGLWALEQNNPALAASYFAYAVEADYKEGKLYQAIALAEAQKINDAHVAWDTVAQSKDEGQRTMALTMEKVLNVNLNEVIGLSDQEKYQFCRYRLSSRDTLLFNKLILTFASNDYKAQALLDMTRRQYEWNNLTQAIRYFNRIGGLTLTDKKLYDEIKHMELLMLAERRELRTLARQINKDITFGEGRGLEKIYYTALLNELAGDTLSAKRNFGIVGTYNPYFEEGIIAAANYFRTRDKSSFKPYTILVEAIQVNNNSVKLMKAYAEEALRMGFDEYATSASQRIIELYEEEYD
jgi:hypothetical protein